MIGAALNSTGRRKRLDDWLLRTGRGGSSVSGWHLRGEDDNDSNKSTWQEETSVALGYAIATPFPLVGPITAACDLCIRKGRNKPTMHIDVCT